jgi:hypothetical protein
MKPLQIRFDLRDVIEEYQISKQQGQEMLQSVVQAVTLEVYRNWTEAAKRQLHQSKFQYLSSLQVVDLGKTTKAIVLNGKLPNMIEDGVSAFDLKKGFMKSKNIKFNKNGGWYLTIPFRFGTPGITGESAVFSSIMPEEIYNIIRGKEGTMTKFGGGKSPASPLGLKEIPSPYNELGRRAAATGEMGNKWAEYVHKTSIYAGMVKDTSAYEKTKQNSYNSFRRAGENSDPNSWIHTGIKAYNLADAAIQATNVRVVVDNAVDASLASMGFSQ